MNEEISGKVVFDEEVIEMIAEVVLFELTSSKESKAAAEASGFPFASFEKKKGGSYGEKDETCRLQA